MIRLIIFAVLLIGMSAYITFTAHSLFSVGAMKKVPAALAWILSALPSVAGLALIPITGRAAVSVVAMAHLTALLLLWDMVLWFVRGDKAKPKAVLFAVSFVLCAAYITYGIINAYTVTPACYTVTTDKPIASERLRIAQISDCHLGTTFDGDGFARHIQAINAHKPDVLVITGDFADSRTSVEDMAAACAALENVQAPLGVYYVSGNHEGSMHPQKNDQLLRLLENSGVTILKDKAVVLSDGVVICGRKDAYDRSRLSVSELMQQTVGPAYTVFLDHQPREYDAYAAQGADLVLSGHTHAGQLFPLGMFIEFIGMGENTYGMEQRSDTSFIVSSGLSGLLPLRTEAKSEYVIVDVVSLQDA